MTPTDTGPRGWFFVTGARKAHFDRGDGIALCGKWSRLGLRGNAALIVAGADAAASPDDCVACRRKLEGLA